MNYNFYAPTDLVRIKTQDINIIVSWCARTSNNLDHAWRKTWKNVVEDEHANKYFYILFC